MHKPLYDIAGDENSLGNEIYVIKPSYLSNCQRNKHREEIEWDWPKIWYAEHTETAHGNTNYREVSWVPVDTSYTFTKNRIKMAYVWKIRKMSSQKRMC